MNIAGIRQLWYIYCNRFLSSNFLNAMKTYFIIIAAFLFAGNLSAQQSHKNKETKAEKTVRIESKYQSMSRLIDKKEFILEADFRSDQHGFRLPISSTLNFIMVDSAIAVIQTGSNNGVGANGVGGLTAEGSISKWKVSKDNKRKSFVISMNVLTAIGSYDIFISVSSSGDASATMSGTKSGKLIYQGRLLSLPESRAFQGITI